jgi:hypothetical protein
VRHTGVKGDNAARIQNNGHNIAAHIFILWVKSEPVNCFRDRTNPRPVPVLLQGDPGALGPPASP